MPPSLEEMAAETKIKLVNPYGAIVQMLLFRAHVEWGKNPVNVPLLLN